LIKPSPKVFINSFDVASDLYCVAIQNMLGVWISPQTQFMNLWASEDYLSVLSNAND